MARPKEFDEDAALSKAAEVFWRNGYHNSSMQELVAETGVCRASLYETYGDKHALYVKALTRYRQQIGKAIGEAVERQSTARNQVRAVLKVVADQLVQDAAKGCFLTNAMLEMLPDYAPTVGALIQDNLAAMEQLFISILENGVASGELRPDLNVPGTARFLISLVGGLNVVGKARPTHEALQEIIDVGLQVLDRQ